MTRLVALALAALFTGAPPKAKPTPHRHRVREYLHGYWVSATAYSACDSGTQTASGRRAFFGEAAANNLPLGTQIHITSVDGRVGASVEGRRDFVILDRIGWGSQLDFFMPDCSWVDRFGRRTVHYDTYRWAWSR